MAAPRPRSSAAVLRGGRRVTSPGDGPGQEGARGAWPHV